ncbi:hypothetical protein Tco_1031892 [Tanacetum coccineum]|uniref:Uncharacterized protein n=1 Tax=Tanacetum coccineum TaxID=301880 RepID=A0ABQ5GAP0_9ASTR
MSSDNASSTVTYTSKSSDSNGPSWGIPLINAGKLSEMDPYEEVAQQEQAAPLSYAYVLDPMELEHHIPVYVSEPVYPEYHVPSDDDIQIEDQPYVVDASPSALSPRYIAESDPEEDSEEDSEEDLINYVADADDDEEEEESSDDNEGEYYFWMLSNPNAYIVSYEEEVAAFCHTYSTAMLLILQLSSPLAPDYLTNPPYNPLHYLHITLMQRANIPEAEFPPWKRLLLTAPIPRFKIGESSTAVVARQSRFNVAHRVDYGFMDTLDASIHASEHKAMAAERIEPCQALDRSVAHIMALEARIAVLETHAYRHEWQRQEADDCAIGHIMRI